MSHRDDIKPLDLDAIEEELRELDATIARIYREGCADAEAGRMESAREKARFIRALFSRRGTMVGTLRLNGRRKWEDRI